MKRFIQTFLFSLLLPIFLNAQNIGIGTPAPDYTLDVNGTVGINSFIYHNDDDNDDTWIGFPSNDKFEIIVGGKRMLSADGFSNELILNPDSDNTKVIIVADGIEHLFIADPVTKSVGVGTSTPQYALDISGDFRVIGDQIEHLFYVDAATGRVGIGTSTPAYSFDVNGLISSDNLRVADNPLPFLETIQTGSELTTYSTLEGSDAHVVTVNFPTPFSSAPNVIGTVENLTGITEQIFGTSLRFVTPTQAVFNVGLLTSGTGNPQGTSLRLNWMAWE